jgi:hypothetical protein
MNKKIFFILMFIFILFFSMNNLLAIGITPSRTTINFEPGLSKEVSFSILNSENKDMSVIFTLQGELAEYITLEEQYAEFSANEKSKSFIYKVNLPSNLEKPGKHEGEIVALEMSKDLKEKGTFIGATVSVITQLHVNVPYPNKYAEADVQAINSDGEIIFIIPVLNKGKLDIVNARATIDIYTALNEKIESLETESISIDSLKRKDLTIKWDSSSVTSGSYLAKVTVFYDNNEINLDKQFKVGEKSINVLEINIKDFRLGGIAKFDALVENSWSEEIKNAYLQIIVYNNEGENMADFKSPLYDIPALSKKEMVSYWDTAGVHEGNYEGKLILRYGEESKERNIQLKITENNIDISGLTGRVVIRGEGLFNMKNILIIIIIAIVFMNIIWFIIIKRLIKKK